MKRYPKLHWLWVASAVGFVLGCHSTSLKPPAHAEAVSAAPETQWEADYTWAQQHASSSPADACQKWLSLSQDTQFPPYQVALLRAAEVCPRDKAPEFKRDQMPHWMQDAITNALLAKAQAQSDKVNEFDLALEKSKQRMSQADKIKWIQIALQDATEAKLADKIEIAQKRLYLVAPRLDPHPDDKQSLSVAQDWRSARDFARARTLYEKVLASPQSSVEDKIVALKGIRQTYKTTRENDALVKASKRLIVFVEKALKFKPTSRPLIMALYEAQVHLGRQLWTMGQAPEAKKLFAKVENTFKGQVSLAEVRWLRARMCEEEADWNCVDQFLNLALSEKITDKDLNDKILWYAGWSSRKQQRWAQSAEQLRTLVESTESDFTRQRALYWMADSLAQNHQDKDANEARQRLVSEDPVGYYGLLARRQLKLLIDIKLPDKTAASASEPVVPLDRRLADWLGRLQENDLLTALLDDASSVYRKQADQSDAGWTILFREYARAGLYMKLYESLATLSPEQRQAILQEHPDLLFPQPWHEEVEAASQRFGVEPGLIYSIIRQESAFNPQARSGADAFGLMQLLPEVAEQLGRAQGLTYSQPDDLYDPKINIPLGAAQLKSLLDRYHGQFILAVAAYNASDSVIHHWLKTRFHGDALEFIEEIPYEETRAYVRLVMRNFIFYQVLRSPQQSVAFPENLIQLAVVSN